MSFRNSDNFPTVEYLTTQDHHTLMPLFKQSRLSRKFHVSDYKQFWGVRYKGLAEKEQRGYLGFVQNCNQIAHPFLFCLSPLACSAIIALQSAAYSGQSFMLGQMTYLLGIFRESRSIATTSALRHHILRKRMIVRSF